MVLIRISACLVVKDEDDNIVKCIESFRHIVDEWIVVDTGSTDETASVARRYGAQVYDFEWVDDFSAARNYALSKASGRWVIFLDADEFLGEIDAQKLRNMLERLGDSQDAVMVTSYDLDSRNNIVAKRTNVRILRNSPDIRYYGRIHEAPRRLTGKLQIVDFRGVLSVFHRGYSQVEIEKRSKNERNIRLLSLELQEKPENGDLHYYLSNQYMALGDWDMTIKHCRLALQYGISLLGGKPKAYFNLIEAMKRKHGYTDEVYSTATKALEEFPDYPDLYILLAQYYQDRGLCSKEIASLERFLQNLERDSRFSVYSYSLEVVKSVFERLGVLYESQGNKKKAVQCFAQVLQSVPFSSPVSFIKLIRLLRSEASANQVSQFLRKIYTSDNGLRYVIASARAMGEFEIAAEFEALRAS